MSGKGTILYIQDLFGSFSKFNNAGFLSTVYEMLDYYSENFDKVYIMTSDDKKVTNLPKNVVHVCIPHHLPFKRLIYFIISGFILLKDVDYVEVTGSTVIIPAFTYKLLGKKIFLYHKWDLAKTLKEQNKLFLSSIAYIFNIIIFKLSDNIAVTTETLKKDVTKYTDPKKIYLLPNYVDTNIFRPTGCKKIFKQLIFVGRLHNDKNLFMLLNVMKDLPDYNLWIIGSGPLRNQLIDEISVNNINNVQLLGTIAHDKLVDYLNQAESLVLVSHIEGHPKVIIEAMSCGLPCIGCDVPGIRDCIIDKKTGMLCSKNKEAIKSAINTLFNDRINMNNMGAVARQYALDNYSKQKIMENKINIIKNKKHN